MEPKKEAIRIIKKHLKFAHITDDDYVFNGAENHYYNAKNCALITVDEIKNFIIKYDNHFIDFKYWDDVKNEIEKI